MKNRLYVTLFFVTGIGVLTAGLVTGASLHYWMWTAAAMILYLWCKDVLTGEGWLQRRKLPAISDKTDAERTVAVTTSWDIEDATLPALSQKEKEGYIELTRLCVAPHNQPALLSQFAAAEEAGPQEKQGTSVPEVIEYLEQTNLSFFIRLDWKAPVGELVLELRYELDRQFALTIDLPEAERYGERVSVSFSGVFADYDLALRRHHMQMGFIDTNSDEYVLVLHRCDDREAVMSAVGKIGYLYSAADVF